MAMIVFLRHEVWHHLPHMSDAVEIFEKCLLESHASIIDLFSGERAVATIRVEVEELFHVCNSGDMVVVRGEGDF